MAATLSIELCQRKRKRVDDFDGDDDADAVKGEGQDGGQVKRRAIATGKGKKKRQVAAETAAGRHTRQPNAVPPETGAGAVDVGDADTTGSDTEWSEGFSSDDEAMEERRAARPPKQARRLARGVTMMTVAP